MQRFRKAARRKAIVAQKRKAEFIGSTLIGRVRRAAAMPIRNCLLSDALFEDGTGTLILARGSSQYIDLSSFLLDVFCLGIKDVLFRTVDADEFDMLRDAMDAASPLAEVDPADARKLLGDLAAWSGSLGFAPHPDFSAVEQIFGDVMADASDAVFAFRHDGKPFYIAGPSESESQSRMRIEHLRKRLGDEGFDFMHPVEM
jgi:hypothetical protein